MIFTLILSCDSHRGHHAKLVLLKLEAGTVNLIAVLYKFNIRIIQFGSCPTTY